MRGLLEIREQLQKFYAKFGFYIRKILQFLVAYMIFSGIGKEIGYMAVLTNTVIKAALALICMVLPVSWTVFVASLMILGHMFQVNLILLGMTAVALLLMYIFYLRFGTMYSWVVLVTPLAMGMKLGYAVPMVLGLTAGPGAAFAAGVGVFGYYFVKFLAEYSAGAGELSKDITAVMGEAGTFIKSAFGNKEMWLLIACFVAVTLVVHVIRRQSFPHSWTAAIIAGAVTNILAHSLIGAKLGVSGGTGGVMAGSILMVIVGLILEMFLFTVNYRETQKVQFEDDEYYYYVKAVPKYTISAPHKEVKTFGRKTKGAAAAVTAEAASEPEAYPEEEYGEYEEYEEYDEVYAEDSYEQEAYAEDLEEYEDYDSGYDGQYEDNYITYEDDDMQIFEEDL